MRPISNRIAQLALSLVTVAIAPSSAGAQRLLPRVGGASRPAITDAQRLALVASVRAALYSADSNAVKYHILAFPGFAPADVPKGSEKSLEGLVGSEKTFLSTEHDLLGSGGDNVERVRRDLRDRSDQIRVQEGVTKRQLLLVQRQQSLDSANKLLAAADTITRFLDSIAIIMPPGDITRHFFPVAIRSRIQATCYWGSESKIFVPGAALLFGSSKSSAVGVDLYSDYAWGTRVTLGTGIAASANADSVSQNAQRFLAEGGNAVLGVAYPLIHVGKRISCENDAAESSDGTASVELTAWPRVGFDIPKLGTETQTATANVDLGGDLRASATTSGRVLTGFLEVRAAEVVGTNAFKAGLGLSRNFFYSQATVGLVVYGAFRISYSYPLAAPSSIRSSLQNVISVGLQQQ